MTWLVNRWRYIEATFWNESLPIEDDSGLVTRTKGTEVTLYILLLKKGTMFFYGDSGRFTEEGIKFQVDNNILEDNSFEIITGRTYITLNGNDYRVMDVKDYSDYDDVQLRECEAVKTISVD